MPGDRIENAFFSPIIWEKILKTVELGIAPGFRLTGGVVRGGVRGHGLARLERLCQDEPR